MEIKAFLCILGAVLINLTLGTFYSISNLFPYVASYMHSKGNPEVTREYATWIVAAFLFGQGIFIIVGSEIERRYNSRVACIFGCVIHSASTFASMWAININIMAVIIIYGFGSGAGCGSAYIASIIAAQKWFPQYKGIATGIIVAGFGFGGLVFTPLQTLFVNPDNLEVNSVTGYFREPVLGRVPYLFLWMAVMFVAIQIVGCMLAFPLPAQPSGTQPTHSTKTPSSASGNNTNVTVVNEEVLPHMSSFHDAFSNKMLYLIGAMMMLVAPGVTFVNALGKSYGQAYIKDDRFLANVVAFSAVANAVGRLTWGFLMDKFSFSTCYSIKVGLFATLIAIFTFILNSKAFYTIWMLGLFFGFSGTFVLFPVFIEQVFGAAYHGIIYGILYLFLALSSALTSLIIIVAVSPVLNSSEVSVLARFFPCLVIAILYCLSLLLFYLLTPVRRLENAIMRKQELDANRPRNSLFNRQDLFPVERGSLAEKTAAAARTASPAAEKENSLGSIVKFRDISNEDKKLKTFTKL